MLRRIRTRFQAADDRLRATVAWRDVLEGLRWLWTHPVLRPIALTAGGLQLAISGVGLVVIVSARDHHATATTTGLLLAGAGVGGVAGAAVATRINNRLGFGRTPRRHLGSGRTLGTARSIAEPRTHQRRPGRLRRNDARLRRDRAQLPARGHTRSPSRPDRHCLRARPLDRGAPRRIRSRCATCQLPARGCLALLRRLGPRPSRDLHRDSRDPTPADRRLTNALSRSQPSSLALPRAGPDVRVLRGGRVAPIRTAWTPGTIDYSWRPFAGTRCAHLKDRITMRVRERFSNA
jgi:hypothetical protein